MTMPSQTGEPPGPAEGPVPQGQVLPLSPDELLTTTRTVRKRLDLHRPVPMSLIVECIEIARQAPSGSNRQGWHWLVVTDPVKRQFIGNIYGTRVEEYLSNGRPRGDTELERRRSRIVDSVAWLGEHMGDVPVLVFACIRAKDLPAENQAGLWGSVLPAAWSYALAARARGLGTAWTTLHLSSEREIGDYFGLPADIRQGVLLPTAFYTGASFKPAPRGPLDEVLHIDGW